jgi:hypothetical protein
VLQSWPGILSRCATKMKRLLWSSSQGKALVWHDGSGSTWLSYNDPGWLAKRHGLGHALTRRSAPWLPRATR